MSLITMNKVTTISRSTTIKALMNKPTTVNHPSTLVKRALQPTSLASKVVLYSLGNSSEIKSGDKDTTLVTPTPQVAQQQLSSTTPSPHHPKSTAHLLVLWGHSKDLRLASSHNTATDTIPLPLCSQPLHSLCVACHSLELQQHSALHHMLSHPHPGHYATVLHCSLSGQNICTCSTECCLCSLQ